MCKVLKVSRSGYYAWLNRKPSKRLNENKNLLLHIRKIYNKSRGTYGSPRITIELKKDSIKASRPRVARLMKQANIRSVVKRKFKTTTYSNHNYPVSPNLLKREFNVPQLGAVWVSDITYVRTKQGWLYLTVIIDLADRKVVGWSTSATMHASNTVIPAWRMAIKNRPINKELIFHSDRGIQYACTAFRNLILKNSLIKQSMSRKGDCWDNAVAESFFKTIKAEWIYQHKYYSKKHAAVSIFDYIETWYNTKRIHSKLNYLSPLEYAKQLYNQKMVA